MLQDFAHDIRFAFRVMRKSAVATTTIVVCLGFGIGATGTVFAWMESVILQPLPDVSDVGRLVSLKMTTATGEANLSYPDYKEIRDAEARASQRTFVDLAAFDIRRLTLRTDAAAEARLAEPLWGVLVSANYFDVLGVRPAVGRGFLPGEDAVARSAPVIVITDALWQRRFAGDRDVIGRRVWVSGRAVTIVGVAPPGFHGTRSRLGMDLWMPVTMHPEVAGNPYLLDERETRWLGVFGRMAPGASLESARASTRATGARLAASFKEDKDLGLTARALDIGPVDRLASLFTVMLGITGLVLLIVCSNVANLLLQRGAAREHEFAVRLAMGARPARLVRQLMTESLLLAIGGVLAGAAVLVSSRNVIGTFMPPSPLPIVLDIPLDARVLLVLTGVGVLTIFVFGLAPAWRSTRVPVRASLSGAGTRGGSEESGRLRGALVSAQFALSLAVLISAGLFLRRLDELQHVERGFRNPEQVLVATIDFELAGIKDGATQRMLVERLLDEISALPGVRATAAASFVPLGLFGYWTLETHVDGYVPQPGESTRFLVNYVSRGYFDVMGIPIRRGRAIDATDYRGTPSVAVVNEAFARRFWGTTDPIGRRLRLYELDIITVVGVAMDGKYQFLAPLDAPSPPLVYLPLAQWGHYEAVLHVRASGDPLALIPSIERTVAKVDARLAVITPGTLDAYSSVPYLPNRLAASVLSVLGAAALGLATLGLYAVTAHAVTQRRKEIGIRMALGATPARIALLFLAHSARYAGAGAVAGVVLAMAIVSGLTTEMPGSVPRVVVDRVGPFVLAFLALAAVSAAAALIASTRAALMSPSAALRDE